MLRIGIFGSTGSIGRNTLDIVRSNSDRLRVTALAAGSRDEDLREQARDFSVTALALGCPGTKGIPGGPEALRALASSADLDLVVNAVVGSAGLDVTLGALDRGTDIALANKESLVMAGELVMARARKAGVSLRPIDSEHAALANCLRGRSPREIRRVYLTASGGPFRGRAAGSFENVTVEEALNHPTWKMGPKITIDSATLMNKALEVIEAHHLFGIPADCIKVIVHPQSIIHAMAEHADGSVVAELAPADMRIPIQRAIFHEDAMENPGAFTSPLDLMRLPALTFEEVDHEAFPLLGLAYEALRRGGTAATAMNAANEAAVEAFLARRISFGEITRVVVETFHAHEPTSAETEEEIRAADSAARKHAEAIALKMTSSLRSA